VVHTLIYENQCDRAANGIALVLEKNACEKVRKDSATAECTVELERRWPGERKDSAKCSNGLT
jgi:hypothetical protein